MRRRLASLTTAAVVSAGLTAVLAGAAPTAAAPTALPIPAFGDIVVDDAHGHVFVTGGTGSSSIVVTDLNGALQTPIPNAHGAQRMQVSHDGTKVFVGLSQADGVGVIDTTTLTMTKISTGAQSCPFDVAETAGRLWYSHGCGSATGAVGYIDLSDSSVHPSIRTGHYNAPALESSAALPGKVVIGEVGVTGHLTVATVTEGESGVTLPTTYTIDVDGRDFAITPDGSRIVATEYDAGYRHGVFLTADGSSDGSYATRAYPNAIAIRGDGMVAAGISGWYDPDVYLYKAGSRTLFRSYEFGGPDANLAEGGLAFGSTRLYAIEQTDYYSDATFRLRVITPRAVSKVTVATSAATYDYAANAKVTVRLTTQGTNKQVSIYAQQYGGAKRLVKTGTVDGLGYLTANVTVYRRTTFSASYAGDGQADPATASKAVAVRAKATGVLVNAIGRSGKYALYKESANAKMVGTVAPNHAGDCLRFRAQVYVSGAWRLMGAKCFPLNSRSKTYGLIDGTGGAGYPVRMRVEWPGNTENAAKTSAWAYLKFVH